MAEAPEEQIIRKKAQMMRHRMMGGYNVYTEDELVAALTGLVNEVRAGCVTPPTADDEVLTELRALRQQIEDTIAVADTESDGDGFITAYHFKTGAIHRLLAMARKGEGHIQREPLPPGTYEALENFKREMEEEVIPEIEAALYERQVLAEEARHRVMKPSGEYGFGEPYEPDIS